ncbi:hypothetical protein TWF718_002191 [Orbilia javanica]|uniref:Periplasmic copper-binding protein NosD beta helix domain-containing protein n=1 Tax=Orbilia javanica TaxID=47235 RepID=A0AAN8MMZ0_9PEZI
MHLAPLILLFSLLTPQISARRYHTHRTIHVKSGGNIQAAISSARPGSTIIVPPGTYAEQLTITTSGLTLIGHDAILTPPSSPITNTCTNLAGAGTQAGICISGSGVVLQNLKDFNGEHLKILSVGSYVKDTTVTGFTVQNFGGLNIATVGSENTVVENNHVGSGSQYGVLTVGSKGTVVRHNTVFSTPGVFGFYFIGVCMDDISTVSIQSNDVSGYFIGLCVQTSHARVMGNYLHDNCVGTFVDPGVKYVMIQRNRIVNRSISSQAACPPDPTFASGVTILGAIGTVVRGNWFENLRNGVVIVDDEGTKTTARGNFVGGNFFRGDGLDLLVNSTGANVVRGNRCRTSSPAGLCK